MNITAYNRTKKQEQRDEARRAGLCGTCAKRVPEVGKKTCKKCLLTRSAARRKARRIARKEAKTK